MGHGYYILEDKKPKQVNDLEDWAMQFDHQNRIVKQDKIQDVKISTVFLGLDHSFDEGVPILFETMIFGGEHDGYQERYATWEEAEKGHEEAIQLVLS